MKMMIEAYNIYEDVILCIDKELQNRYILSKEVYYMAQMSFRINEGTKKDFEEVCNDLGLNPTTALTIFIKKMCRERRIPFEVSMYNSDTLRALDETIQGKNLSKTFSNVDELFEDLNA